jgi:3-methylfumaryl-CoA hydratase
LDAKGAAQPTEYDAYVGRQERISDVLDRHRVADLAALLDLDIKTIAPNETLPPLAHWLYFNPWTRQSELGEDGHPRRGEFMPPVTLPRRMFAGGRVSFHANLPLGQPAERLSTIAAIQRKSGASGDLVFVTVRHEIFGAHGLAIEEEQDIVYRGEIAPGSQESAKAEPQPASIEAGSVVKQIRVDPVLLFRFSALTSNGHRIHYDYPYATGVELYPGLVVHGPLQAIMMLALVQEHFPEPIVRFTFQARRPLFDTSPFVCVARRTEAGVDASTRDAIGHVCTKASVTFA